MFVYYFCNSVKLYAKVIFHILHCYLQHTVSVDYSGETVETVYCLQIYLPVVP